MIVAVRRSRTCGFEAPLEGSAAVESDDGSEDEFDRSTIARIFDAVGESPCCSSSVATVLVA